MKSAVLAVAALALLAAASMAAATAPTMRGALSQSGLTYVQGVIVPLILAKFGTFSLPDMSFSKDSIDATVSGLTCSSLAIPTHSLTLGTSSLSLSMGGISASCHASWSYKESHWPHIPHGSGTVDAGVSQSTITVSVTPTEANGKPQVAPAGCSANVKVSSLEFHGGLSGDILNLFKGYIEKEISSSLNSQLCSKVNDFIKTDLNAMLATFPTQLPLPLPAPFNYFALNFALSDNPSFGQGYLGFDVSAAVEDTHSHATDPVTPAPLPPFSSAFDNHYAQVFLDDSVFDSGGWAAYEAGLLHWTVLPSMVPSSSPIKLDTTSLKGLAPGLYKKYPDMPLQIFVNASSAPTVTSDTVGANATAPLDFNFGVQVNGNTSDIAPVFVLACPIIAAAEFQLGENSGTESLFANLTYLNCQLKVAESSVGSVEVGLIQILINGIVDGLVLPDINKKIAGGLPLPTLAGLAMTDSTVFLGDGWIGLASNFTYTPPSV